MSIRLSISRFVLLAIGFTTALSGASTALAQSTTESTSAAATVAQRVVMRTNVGDVTIELDAGRAPETVQNFLAYVDEDFYADTLFHRVIEGFMIQGGGFSTSFRRKTTRPPVSNEAYNGLQNRQYTIAMARTTAPHSATSQFFINTANNRNLNHTATTPRGWGYTVFGKVVNGQEVVDEISRVKTSSGGPFSKDVPVSPIIIEAIDRITIPASADDNVPDAPGKEVEGAAATSSTIEKTQHRADSAQLKPVNGSLATPNTELVKQN